MKTLLSLCVVLITGALASVLSFATDATSSSHTFSSTIIPLLVLFGFFGLVLFIIGKKGYDIMLSR
ncbi:MAG: hypothetical protein M0Q91_03110 [Methanoregula sp.]|nr:hypothetical protein [Methanoregula sp.]